MRHIPNILSSFRLVLVGVFVWLFRAGEYWSALCVFVTAFFTDVLDGFLARRFHWVSNVGKLLDPLADKLMTIAALGCIYFGRRNAVYFVVFATVMVKELLMLIGGLLLTKKAIIVYAGWPGKVATGMFALGVTLALVSFAAPKFELAAMVILCVATALSCYAFVYYAGMQWKNIFSKSARGRPTESAVTPEETCINSGQID